MDLIGREAELRVVTERVRNRRLVTLVGPGGIGKTALARAVLDRCAADFGEGAHVVDVTRVDSTAAVRESFAAQLGYTSYRALLESPGDHPVLLLVDNCEHVIDAAAEAIDQLLGACELPTVLATSRTALDLPGETLVPIGPLALPPKGTIEADAVRLFVERACDVGVKVEPGEVVAELCRRLDGVPLAIELAAARARAMAPAEILERLLAGLDVLDRPRRRAARRHQSLRAAIGWSYDLLDDDERYLFDRLSVFPGPFTSGLAHAVAGVPGATAADTQDVLDRLVAASMVVADPSGTATWYRLLETLRAYARDRLDEADGRQAVEARFVDHVVTRVASIIERGATTWSESVMAELLALYESVTAAVRWCLASDDSPDRALMLVAALWAVVHQAHTEEVGDLALEVLARWPAADTRPFRADAIATAATCLYMLGDDTRAVAMATDALAVADSSPYAPATLRRAIAQSSRATGDTEGALRWFTEAAEAARRTGLVAMALESDAGRSQVLADLGRADEALELIAAVRAEAATSASKVSATWARSVEGSILLRVAPERARAVLDEALAASRALGYPAGVSVNLRSLALAALQRDDVPAAAAHALELLGDLLQRGSTYELRSVLEAASPALARSDQVVVAADLAATALSLPVVSITASVGHELFPLDPEGGRVLSRRDAMVLTREHLAAVADGGADIEVEVEVENEVEVEVENEVGVGVGERTGVFRRSGELWEVGLGKGTVSVRDSKGMADIARLMAAPGREVHCLELIGGKVVEGDTGEVLDATARRAYEDRIRELQRDVDAAQADGDPGRAERAQVELDALVDQLVSALGLGGNARRTGGAAERARSAVTQRVRATIRRIDAVHPRLGRHLHSSIRTGTFCAYTPEDPVRWELRS